MDVSPSTTVRAAWIFHICARSVVHISSLCSKRVSAPKHMATWRRMRVSTGSGSRSPTATIQEVMYTTVSFKPCPSFRRYWMKAVRFLSIALRVFTAQGLSRMVFCAGGALKGMKPCALSARSAKRPPKVCWKNAGAGATKMQDRLFNRINHGHIPSKNSSIN